MAKPPPIRIHYATSDDDVILIHRFLCIVAGPNLPAPIDARPSINEVWRVCNHDVALLAFRGEVLLGTLGLIRPKAWWGEFYYLANRWFFCLPDQGAGKALLKEGLAIATASSLELHIIAEDKGRYLILNRSKLRSRHSVAQDELPPAATIAPVQS